MTKRGYDFAAFGLSEMVRAAAALREGAERAADFPAAARSVVEQLRAGFVDDAGAPVLQLVRLFTTRRLADLEPDLLGLLHDVPQRPDLRCLTLTATAGVEPEWNDPALSGPYRVLALPSAEAVAAAPMFSALIRELGISAADLVAGAEHTGGRRFGVFHVPVALDSPRVPDQDFVARHDIASVLGFGGVLPDGGIFCVVMFSRAHIPSGAAEQFRAVAVSVRAGLLDHPRTQASLAAQRDALREHLSLLEETSQQQGATLQETVDRLRTEAALVDTLQVVGQRLTSQLDLDTLVQDATAAATLATGAHFGAFFYNLIDQYGESYMLYTLSGVPREAFSSFPMPRNTAVFAPTFHGNGTVRCVDITQDERFGKNPPYHGMPAGHLPVRSYLAVSVISPTSREVLGGFFFGHPEPDRFTARHEQLAEGIAGYAAIALDNARLFAQHRRMATELARSMLPTVPAVPGLEIVSRYLPAAVGSEVGGDWFDVIELPAGRTGLVIGDVVGRGVGAAAVMGQIRTAVRSYALLDMPPADVLRQVCELANTIQDDPFITCLYAVHDPVDNTLTVANAGHLPAVLLGDDGSVEFVGSKLGMPLGVGERFTQQTASFPPGARLALYSDGLVETRSRGVTEGIDELVRGLRVLPAGVDARKACDELIDGLTAGRHDDDVALLYVHHTGTQRSAATMQIAGDPASVAQARAFVTARLTEWELTDLLDVVVTITSELVTNAIMHADGPAVLRLHHDGTRLVIDVTDHGSAWPRVFDAGPDEEQHRGLAIVQAFSNRWGTRATQEGKVVWAEITQGT